MAETENTEEIAERLAKLEERLILATAQAAFATAFAAAIMRELIRSGTLKTGTTKQFVENAFAAVKDHRQNLSEQDQLGYDIALDNMRDVFGSAGRRE